MIKTIVKLHGTSGSGKSTVARGLIRAANSIHEIKDERGKVEAYELQMPGWDQYLYIIGEYSTTCGGVDTINRSEELVRRIQVYAPIGHVFYEGLLVSEYYGVVGKASEQYGDDHVFAFLDTPIELCIERVKQRRLEAGNPKPLNEENTRNRVKKIERLKYRLLNEFDRNVVTIDHSDALSQVLELFHGR